MLHRTQILGTGCYRRLVDIARDAGTSLLLAQSFIAGTLLHLLSAHEASPNSESRAVCNWGYSLNCLNGVI